MRGGRLARRAAGALLAMSASASVLAVASCGARDGLLVPPLPPPPPECFVDEDCPTWGDLCNPVTCDAIPDADAGTDAGFVDVSVVGGHCVQHPPVDCDDNDPCTDDACDSDTGVCHYAPATLDLDGDGYRAPLPGHQPGDPGSCGDDCDDTNPNAHPGGVEVCDGVDNDCNGVIDDNETYVPLDLDAHRIDGELAPASPAGLAWSGDSYFAAYTGTVNGTDVYEQLLDPSGVSIPPGETQFTLDNADATGGPVVWVGDRYGMVWEDRRDGDYEIYFSIIGPDGAKAIPDTRLTFAEGFSIYPTLAWNGNEFIAVWQDQRNGEFFDLYAQRIDVNGVPVGSNVALTDNNEIAVDVGSESPVVAVGAKSLGVAWSEDNADAHTIEFQTFSPDLAKPSSPVISITDGTTDVQYPTVVFSKDRYVVAWYDTSAFPKAIYAATIDETGNVLTPPTPITNPGPFHSRYPFLRPLGDRLLLVFSDDRDQNDGYEIYSEMLSLDLQPLGGEMRLTNAPHDSIFPIASFGPDGNVGILFRDDRENGAQHVYFTRLQCTAMTTP